ncbi:FAD-dependent oxidoreductase [uncultured Oscillibacter sp.]|uniref:FAD-dependent oxidoreductase n=1 Tax=uncultured Oscillibacter sp. TaxID=876091 RepID=UPI0026166876|nr:FAD-dependent oxidoreductase [uncultured Oscillibacter sp.]
MDSIWKQTAELPRFAPLEGDLKTDVLVIGGGMAGLLCAYWLDRAGVDYALVEARRLCGGVTGNTTAKLTFQHGLIYARLLREFGLGRARLYLEANRAALGQYRELCREAGCDFQERDAYVYALTDRRKLDRELEALERLGFPAEFSRTPALPMPTAGAVKFTKQAQFHPLKFAAAIAKGLRIFEGTKVLELAPGRAVTNRGTVTAENIVAATHFPLLNKHGAYFLKLYQARSYVLALENVPEVGGMYVDEGEKGLSFRDYKGFLLLGGGGHRTGKKGGGWRELEDFAKRRYPQAGIAARWAAQDCMTLDGVPYVGRYSRGTKGLYVATGFNKWGMTSSMAAARLLADLVQGKENPWAELFSPSRRVLRPQLAANAWESTMGLLTPTVPRCPHMGCALKYNPQEHSWDCPCHGSRFGEDGELLDNPATDGKRL